MKTRLRKEDKIREAAYFNWLKNGPDSSAIDNWVAAEKEITKKKYRRRKDIYVPGMNDGYGTADYSCINLDTTYIPAEKWPNDISINPVTVPIAEM